MIINGANIVGATIISSQDKRKVAEISDIVMSPKKQKIEAFLLSNGFTGKALLFKDIKKLSSDEVVIDSEKVFKDVTSIVQEDPDNNIIASMPVATEKGEAVGIVNDIFFDTSSGQVKELSVSDTDDLSPHAKTLISSKKIVSIGDDAVIVKQLHSGKPQKKSSSQKSKSQSSGFVKQAESAAKKAYQSAKSSLKQMA